METLPETQETLEHEFSELDWIREDLLQIRKAVNYAIGRCEELMRKSPCELSPWFKAGMSRKEYEFGIKYWKNLYEEAEAELKHQEPSSSSDS